VYKKTNHFGHASCFFLKQSQYISVKKWFALHIPQFGKKKCKYSFVCVISNVQRADITSIQFKWLMTNQKLGHGLHMRTSEFQKLEIYPVRIDTRHCTSYWNVSLRHNDLCVVFTGRKNDRVSDLPFPLTFVCVSWVLYPNQNQLLFSTIRTTDLLALSRDMAVSIATGYGLDGRGVAIRVPVEIRFFLLSMLSRKVLRPTQPTIRYVPGSFSPGVKWPGREAEHSPPTSAAVKKTWIYTTTPPYVFIAYCFIS
jgi:hypothetical protein